jgi:hypothetical protein
VEKFENTTYGVDIYERIRRLADWNDSQARQMQEFAVRCSVEGQGIRYSEAAAGYRRARNDLNQLLSDFPSAPKEEKL